MATTPRSELLNGLERAFTDEVYDGGLGALTEVEFSRLVGRLAETAVVVLSEAFSLSEGDVLAEAELRHPFWQRRRAVHCGHWGTGFVEGALWAATTTVRGGDA